MYLSHVSLFVIAYLNYNLGQEFFLNLCMECCWYCIAWCRFDTSHHYCNTHIKNNQESFLLFRLA